MKEMDDESNSVDGNDDDLLKIILEQLEFVTLNVLSLFIEGNGLCSWLLIITG